MARKSVEWNPIESVSGGASALYRDGPSAQQQQRIYKHRDGELISFGRVADTIGGLFGNKAHRC